MNCTVFTESCYINSVERPGNLRLMNVLPTDDMHGMISDVMNVLTPRRLTSILTLIYSASQRMHVAEVWVVTQIIDHISSQVVH